MSDWAILQIKVLRVSGGEAGDSCHDVVEASLVWHYQSVTVTKEVDLLQ